MNQASWYSCPVPVLPATGRPMFAAVPVPDVTTPSRSEVTRAAIDGGMTCSHWGLALNRVCPVGPLTLVMANGSQCMPWFASVEYPDVIESGLTLTAPRVMAQYG